jgi:hypothetical protein
VVLAEHVLRAESAVRHVPAGSWPAEGLKRSKMKKKAFGVLISVVAISLTTDRRPQSPTANSMPLHPFVGLMVAQDAGGNPLWRCSGTLFYALPHRRTLH